MQGGISEASQKGKVTDQKTEIKNLKHGNTDNRSGAYANAIQKFANKIESAQGLNPDC